MYVCQRCGNFNGFPVKLAGQFNAQLCVKCMNEWHVACSEIQEYKDMDRSYAIQLTMMGTNGEGEARMLVLLAEYRALEKKLCGIAQEWVEKKKGETQ